MSNNKRNREAIKEMLKGRQLTTIDIHDALNAKYRYGPTINQVGNLLARTSGIEKIGMIDRTYSKSNAGKITDRYIPGQRIRIALWELKTD